MRLFVCLLAVSSAACVTTRSIAAEPYVTLSEPPLPARWTLSQVAVLPPTNPELTNQRFSALITQLEGHARDALSHEPALGQYQTDVRDADFAVELELRMIEGAAVNGLYGLTLTQAFAGPLAGAAVGAAVSGPGAPLGIVVGAAIGGVAALVGSALTPAMTYAGQLEAVMTIRRAADGAEIARRTAHVEWDTKMSAVNREQPLALGLGSALPQLERDVATELRKSFAVLSPPPLAESVVHPPGP